MFASFTPPAIIRHAEVTHPLPAYVTTAAALPSTRESTRLAYYRRQATTARRLADFWAEAAAGLAEGSPKWRAAVERCGEHECRYVRAANLALVLNAVKGE